MNNKLKLTDDDVQAALIALRTQTVSAVAKAMGVKYETLRAALNRHGYSSDTRADGWDTVLSGSKLKMRMI